MVFQNLGCNIDPSGFAQQRWALLVLLPTNPFAYTFYYNIAQLRVYSTQSVSVFLTHSFPVTLFLTLPTGLYSLSPRGKLAVPWYPSSSIYLATLPHTYSSMEIIIKSIFLSHYFFIKSLLLIWVSLLLTFLPPTSLH